MYVSFFLSLNIFTYYLVTPAQRADIANLFYHTGTYLTSRDFAANLPVPPAGYLQGIHESSM
jgi:hypothetical protein